MGGAGGASLKGKAGLLESIDSSGVADAEESEERDEIEDAGE